jgi:large repetitive protein
MNRVLRLVWSSTLILLLGWAMVFSVPPALARQVSCGAVLTEDTTLDNDLLDCPGDGLVVGTADITVNLNGHTIDGTRADDSAGIRNEGYNRVVIKNGVVQDFERGIVLANGAHTNLLRSLTVRDNGSDGIQLVNARINRIIENTIQGNSTGIVLFQSNDNRIRDNDITDNSVNPGLVLEESDGNWIIENRITGLGVPALIPGAIVLRDSNQNRIIENTLQSAGGPGIALHSSAENRLVRNDLVNNETAIVLFDADDNLIERNLAGAIGSDGNGGSGIALFGSSDDNRVRHNITAENDEYGMFVGSGSRRNTIEKNTVHNNFLDGIFVEAGSDDTRIVENTATNNRGDDGIDVDDPDTIITGNTANFNVDLGIEAVPGVTDGGGNEAEGNGNSAQCLNVVCT